MEYREFLDYLDADFGRLREVVPVDLDAPVPTCPAWKARDLASHVGEVYTHKTLAMREGAEPEQWPPPGLAGVEPLALLDRSYAELVAEFAARRPEEKTGTWYKPDQTVGFWARRMAQETVVHRIDAELALDQAVAPVPDNLALDGIDELLKVFLAYGVAEWGRYFTDILANSPGRSYRIESGDRVWQVRSAPGTVSVKDGPPDGSVDVTVNGPPEAVLRWVWNREGAGEDSGVTVEGPAEAVDELRRCIVVATE